MLRDGAKAAEIVKALPVTKAVVYRIYNESVLGNVKKPAPKKQPLGRGRFHRPTHQMHRAKRLHLRRLRCQRDQNPEQIRLMHADDEQERLESHLDALERRGLRSVVEATRNGGNAMNDETLQNQDIEYWAWPSTLLKAMEDSWYYAMELKSGQQLIFGCCETLAANGFISCQWMMLTAVRETSRLIFR